MTQARAGSLSWVIGAGGLLGSSVVDALARRGEVWVPPEPVPWGAVSAAGVLVRQCEQFAAAAEGRPWQVAWCAGAGVTGTTVETLAAEAGVFQELLDALAWNLRRRAEDGVVFVASSAGGLYAGCSGGPFDETTVPVPISAYGQAKVDIEERARGFAERTRTRVCCGRISNLYGPKQDLAKPQGLISHICRSYLLAKPLTIYVSLDTVRDYLYAPDCGELVAGALEQLRAEAEPFHVKVLAAQQGTTVGQLVAESRRLFKRRPRITFGAHPNADLQARDLRLRSVVWPSVDRRTMTPLAAGIRSTVTAQLVQLQAGRLS